MGHYVNIHAQKMSSIYSEFFSAFFVAVKVHELKTCLTVRRRRRLFVGHNLRPIYTQITHPSMLLLLLLLLCLCLTLCSRKNYCLNLIFNLKQIYASLPTYLPTWRKFCLSLMIPVKVHFTCRSKV